MLNKCVRRLGPTSPTYSPYVSAYRLVLYARRNHAQAVNSALKIGRKLGLESADRTRTVRTDDSSTDLDRPDDNGIRARRPTPTAWTRRSSPASAARRTRSRASLHGYQFSRLLPSTGPGVTPPSHIICSQALLRLKSRGSKRYLLVRKENCPICRSFWRARLSIKVAGKPG